MTVPTTTTTTLAVPSLNVTPLLRKAFAELLGSALLAATVVGSGIAAQRLSPNDIGLELLENSLITGAALIALILAFGPVSAAFNPVVTLAERVFGAISNREAGVFIAAQIAGCCLGTILANLMFDLNPVTLSTHHRDTGGLWLGEIVATFGLLVVIFGVVRAGRGGVVAFAVGGYITAAYWFTSSTSFANPAISIGRMLSNSFAGIAPSSVPMFVLMQLLGGALALGAVIVLYPNASQVADEGPVMTTPVILFACVHNGGRSLAAKVLTQHYAGTGADVRSAGSEPGSSLNPAVVEVLHERGLSTDGEAPKLLTFEGVQEADIVITMGCGETCPLFPGKRYEDWELEDPKGKDLDTVRRIVSEIDDRIQALLADLGVELGTSP
jgi:arsenate reductase